MCLWLVYDLCMSVGWFVYDVYMICGWLVYVFVKDIVDDLCMTCVLRLHDFCTRCWCFVYDLCCFLHGFCMICKWLCISVVYDLRIICVWVVDALCMLCVWLLDDLCMYMWKIFGWIVYGLSMSFAWFLMICLWF